MTLPVPPLYGDLPLRTRACAAIIENGSVVMIKYKLGNRTIWTFPGGGVEEKESLHDAARREVLEETGLTITIVDTLYEKEDSKGRETCFLAVCAGRKDLTIGYDPEDAGGEQSILDVQWKNIDENKDDVQVKEVVRYIEEYGWNY